MEKAREWLHSKSCKAAVVVTCAVSALAPAASASGSPDSSAAITTAFSTGFQKMASDALSMIAVIVPIALSVAGVVFLVKKAMSWFKTLAK